MVETIIEMIISGLQNEVRDFMERGIDIIPHRKVNMDGIETLVTLFNAAGGGRLYVENLKGATGEVALRLGEGYLNVFKNGKIVFSN
jgi:hypothetical protein